MLFALAALAVAAFAGLGLAPLPTPAAVTGWLPVDPA